MIHIAPTSGKNHYDSHNKYDVYYSLRHTYIQNIKTYSIIVVKIDEKFSLNDGF